MKTVLVILASVLGLSYASAASPILLEKTYTNYAWGESLKGCLVDVKGNVYGYDLPMKPIAKVEGTSLDVNAVWSLLNGLNEASYSERHVMADAGTTEWRVRGSNNPLKKRGDLRGDLNHANATLLVNMVDDICKRAGVDVPVIGDGR